MVSFASNITGLAVNRNAALASEKLGSSFQRLSSGVRINRAVDDPGSQGTSNDLNLRVALLNRSKLNIGDGISLFNVVDSSLRHSSDLLTRMEELAGQAATGTLSKGQRQALSREYVSLDKELRRIAADTEINGLKLLEGGEKYSSTVKTTVYAGGSAPGVLAVSADGTYFTYLENGLVGETNIFQKNSLTGVTTSIATTDDNGDTARASADGSLVIYTDDKGGARSNLYLYNRATGTTTQLTNSQGAETFAEFEFSADGSTVIFSSFTRYAIGGSSASSYDGAGARLFTLDVNTGIYNGVAQDVNTGSLQALHISADGTKVTFTTTANLTGGNADLNREVFYANFSSIGPSFQQATNTTVASNENTQVDDTGKIYFTSDANINGLNPNGVRQVYSYDTTTQSYGVHTKLRSSVTFSAPRITTDGSAYVFTSTSNVTGESSGGIRQLYRLDTELDRLTQVTNFTSDVIKSGVYSGDGHTLFADDGLPSNLLFSVNAITQDSTFTIDYGLGTRGQISTVLDAVNGLLRGLGGFAISSQVGARAALDKMSENLDTLHDLEGKVAATLGRFEAAHSTIGTEASASGTALGKIRDVNVAEEASLVVRRSIAREAANALLAQANQQPQIVLSLLQG